jgi:multidrug efflux pump subunit AcrA (membrane-fusion protein)
MNIRKLLIIISFTIISALFGLTAYISYNSGVNHGVANAENIRSEKKKIAETHNKKVKSVLVTKVKNSKLKNIISSTGRVVSLNNITISSQVQGRLVGNNTFKKGNKINQGDIIFSVRNTDLVLLIEAKKSLFMSLVSASLSDINLDFNNEYAKWDNFFNAIDLKNNLPDFPEMNTSKEKNFIISRKILAEYLSLKADEEKLSKYTVLAPFDGIITKSYTDVGANVNPGTPVVDFIRKGIMEVELTVNKSEIQFININDTVFFTENNEIFIGKIIRKSEFINTNTQNISVFATLTDNASSLLNGMYLDAEIITKGTEKTFRLSRRAVFDKNKVFILDSNKRLEIMKVDIIAFEANTVIIDNLIDEMLIVNEPLINSTEGDKVKEILK